jgi:hypothetical protein
MSDWHTTVPAPLPDSTATMREHVWHCPQCGRYRNYLHGEVFHPPPCPCGGIAEMIRRPTP